MDLNKVLFATKALYKYNSPAPWPIDFLDKQKLNVLSFP